MMMMMMTSPNVEWPIVIFEIDDWPEVVRSPEELVDLYEDDFWDEVALAFDSHFWSLKVVMKEGMVPSLVRTGERPEPLQFATHARGALEKFDRKGVFRWHAAGGERIAQIRRLALESLMHTLLGHFASDEGISRPCRG